MKAGTILEFKNEWTHILSCVFGIFCSKGNSTVQLSLSLPQRKAVGGRESCLFCTVTNMHFVSRSPGFVDAQLTNEECRWPGRLSPPQLLRPRAGNQANLQRGRRGHAQHPVWVSPGKVCVVEEKVCRYSEVTLCQQFTSCICHWHSAASLLVTVVDWNIGLNISKISTCWKSIVISCTKVCCRCKLATFAVFRQFSPTLMPKATQ